MRCEGDRSCPVYATAEKEGEEDAAVFEGSPEVIFIVLHSNAHAMIKVRDQREGGFFGTVRPKFSCLQCVPYGSEQSNRLRHAAQPYARHVKSL